MASFNYKVRVPAPSLQVYEILKDVTSFNEFMSSVKKIDIIKKENNILHTKWYVDFDGVAFEWTEELVFDDKSCSIKFKSITGDYKRSGQWNVYYDDEKKTWISLAMKYDWNVPNFEHFFGDIYNKKAEKATKGMLYALKKRASK